MIKKIWDIQVHVADVYIYTFLLCILFLISITPSYLQYKPYIYINFSKVFRLVGIVKRFADIGYKEIYYSLKNKRSNKLKILWKKLSFI